MKPTRPGTDDLDVDGPWWCSQLVTGPAGRRPRPWALIAPEAPRNEGYDTCIDVTAVDYLDVARATDLPAERHTRAVRDRGTACCRTSTTTDPDSGPGACGAIRVVPTVFDLHPGTEAFEREAYDCSASTSRPPRHDPHPHARTWEGHPLPQGLRVRAHPGAVQGCPLAPMTALHPRPPADLPSARHRRTDRPNLGDDTRVRIRDDSPCSASPRPTPMPSTRAIPPRRIVGSS